MALSRRTGQRFQGSIWPGFVDAMTGLLLVLMFVLTIFMVVQSVLRDTISGQENELDALSAEVSALARALGVKEREASDLETRLGTLGATLSDTQSALATAQNQLSQQAARIAALTGERDQTQAELDAAQTRITGFEAQVAALIAGRDAAEARIADLTAARDALAASEAALIDERAALNLALAQTRTEIDVHRPRPRVWLLPAARRWKRLSPISRRKARHKPPASAIWKPSSRRRKPPVWPRPPPPRPCATVCKTPMRNSPP